MYVLYAQSTEEQRLRHYYSSSLTPIAAPGCLQSVTKEEEAILPDWPLHAFNELHAVLFGSPSLPSFVSLYNKCDNTLSSSSSSISSSIYLLKLVRTYYYKKYPSSSVMHQDPSPHRYFGLCVQCGRMHALDALVQVQ